MADKPENQKNNAKFKTSAFRDLVALVIISIFVFILSYYFDVFIFIVKFLERHPRKIVYVDEVVTGLLTLSITLAVFAWRRWSELKKESAERLKLQEDLITFANTKTETERIINKQLHSELEQRKALEEKLKTLASHDELTGCVNYRALMERLENEIARSKRYQKKFSIIMIDIDHFKRINDEHGHLAGNDALVAFTGVIKKTVRGIDSVGRYGGEEFIIVLPESDSRHALVVLERIRNNLQQTKITSPHLEKDQEFKLKFSAGIAVFPQNAKDLKELIWVADSALLQAKQRSKN